MSLILRRKLESAIVAYLQANATEAGIASGQIVPGSVTSEPSGDWLVVSVPKLVPHPDGLPQVKLGQVLLHYKSAATVGGSERAAVDTALEKLDTFITKPVDNSSATGWTDANKECGVLLAALNKPVGTDNRTIKPLHIYYLGPSDEAGDVEKEGWHDQLLYEIIAQPMDSS